MMTQNMPKQASRRQIAFVDALSAGMTIQESASALGISERTARRWYADARVRAALKAVQADALADVTRRMNAGSRAALDVLSDVMNDKDQSGAVRIRAADLWLSHAFRARELLDIEERLQALEKVIHERAR